MRPGLREIRQLKVTELVQTEPGTSLVNSAPFPACITVSSTDHTRPQTCLKPWFPPEEKLVVVEGLSKEKKQLSFLLYTARSQQFTSFPCPSSLAHNFQAQRTWKTSPELWIKQFSYPGTKFPASSSNPSPH